MDLEIVLQGHQNLTIARLRLLVPVDHAIQAIVLRVNIHAEVHVIEITEIGIVTDQAHAPQAHGHSSNIAQVEPLAPDQLALAAMFVPMLHGCVI